MSWAASAVFTSDAKSRWAANWMTWPGYDKFWTNLFRDLLPHAAASEATATYDSANDELVVDYRLGRHVPEPAVIPDIYVFGPDGFQRPVKASKLAAGSFRVTLPIGKRQGLFRVRPLVRIARVPRDRTVPAGRGDDRLRLERFRPAADLRGDRRPLQSQSQGCVRSGRAQHSVDDGAVAGTAGAGGRAESGRADHAQGKGLLEALRLTPVDAQA